MTKGEKEKIAVLFEINEHKFEAKCKLCGMYMHIDDVVLHVCEQDDIDL